MQNESNEENMLDTINMTVSRHKFSLRNKLGRIVWNIVYVLLFRPFSLRLFRKWRIVILRLFGAKISWTVTVHSSMKIWAPWNLEIGPYTCIGPDVDCYNQGKIIIGSNTTVSQKAYLCASSHDYTSMLHDLILRPIMIHDRVWIAADAFIGPGITIHDGAVIAARSVVSRDVEKWTVVGGNPAKFIKTRELKN